MLAKIEIYLEQYVQSLPSLAARDVLTEAVSTDLLPLHLLAGNGKLSTKALERTLRSLDKRPVQSFLVIALSGRNLGNNRLSRHGGEVDADGLVGVECHVAILVVVHVDLDLAGQGGGGGDGDLVNCAEATVPTTSSACVHLITGIDLTTHQKLLGEYRLATRRIATAESFSIG